MAMKLMLGWSVYVNGNVCCDLLCVMLYLYVLFAGVFCVLFLLFVFVMDVILGVNASLCGLVCVCVCAGVWG